MNKKIILTDIVGVASNEMEPKLINLDHNIVKRIMLRDLPNEMVLLAIEINWFINE